MNGVLPLDKPAGLTSATALNRLKRLLPKGTKVGHAGTLDMFATGMVLVLIGRATKTCEQMMGLRKTYRATVRLGATTPTLDPTVEPTVLCPPLPLPSEEAVRQSLVPLRGEILQIPPDFSALKSGGKRLSDRVRAGETVNPQPRPVTIYTLELLSYANGHAEIAMECSRGTYVRSVARDIGTALGVGGYLTALRRTAIGPFDESSLVALDDALDAERVGRVLEETAKLLEG